MASKRKGSKGASGATMNQLAKLMKELLQQEEQQLNNLTWCTNDDAKELIRMVADVTSTSIAHAAASMPFIYIYNVYPIIFPCLLCSIA